MPSYEIEYSDEAIADLDSSLAWGFERWGAVEAATWYVEMTDSISKTLGSFPLGQPLAPENSEYGVEVRQMIVGRYCVIFSVRAKVVTVLHVRGLYTGE